MASYVRKKIWYIKVYLLYQYYRYKYLEVLDLNFFIGKTVAIVGPADSALEIKNGSYIDTFDIVIRINKGIEIADRYPEFLGTKTDILVHGLSQNTCGKIDKKLWKKKGVIYTIYPENYDCSLNFSALMQYFTQDKVYLKIQQPSKKYYSTFRDKLGNSFPNSGFSSIYYVLNSKPKKVFITGFTFYKTPYVNEYASSVGNENILDEILRTNYHNPNNDFDLFKNMIKESSLEIEVDNQLKSILCNEGIILP